ncbi:ABC transporter permease [Aquabacterium sp. A3]|uniref:MlaE family ABC transporter permease n=1 Tax=Aquabacterium sp. A3 TaxID=3132829 RepID=UPI00311A473D
MTLHHGLAQSITLLGDVGLALIKGLGHGWRFRRADFVRVLLASSAQALPIVLVVNLLVGAIIAFVGAVQLLKFGAGVFVADLVAIAVSREMAAVITAVVMAGRTGAAFAAELASMKANEEIDALEVLGIQPVAYLVVPRVLALLLMLPLLYGFACVAGLAGGYAVSASLLDLPPVVYTNRSIEALSLAHLGLGFSKCFAFGLLVALAGCHHGLQADRDAAGVGQATTRAVVAGIVGVIAIDAVFAVCANALGV